MSHVIHTGSNLDVLPTLPDNSVDAIVTDPPYELGFMGKSWDSTGIAYNVSLWKECMRVLKPGGHLLAFSGSRTYHRMTCAIEDAGFEVRDQMMWVYGSGFPKSHNISKALDKAVGVEREVIGTRKRNAGSKSSHAFEQSRELEFEITAPATAAAKRWQGWGTALKPAHEPICLARKPLDGTVADNVRKWGVGGLNIDGCRVDFVSEADKQESIQKNQHADFGSIMGGNQVYGDYSMLKPQNYAPKGRFPANLMHDGSQEVLELFPGDGEQTAARFFYCPKASKADRDEGCEGLEGKTFSMSGNDSDSAGDIGLNRAIHRKNFHPTVKPTELMRYLCRLITPPGGTVLDPFNGSGSTGKAAVLEGFNYIGIEMNPEYVSISEARIKAALER